MTAFVLVLYGNRAGGLLLIAGQGTFCGVIIATMVLRSVSRRAMSAYMRTMSLEVERCIDRVNAQLVPQGVRLRQYRPMGIGSPHQALRLEFVGPSVATVGAGRFPVFAALTELPRSTTARIASQLANVRDPPGVVRAALASERQWWRHAVCGRGATQQPAGARQLPQRARTWTPP
jgi:hypothetical protein